MNWDAIGAVGDLVGGIGVIISLIYLATQIRSAERMIRFELRDRHLSDWRDRFFQRSLHPEREVEANRLGHEMKDQLTPHEFAIWTTTAMHFFVEMQANYDLYREGIFSDEDFEILVKQRIRTQFGNVPRTRLSWERSKSQFPDYFCQFIEDELSRLDENTATPE